jgi:hypothetical protein
MAMLPGVRIRMLGLNIISSAELINRHGSNPGWCALFEWSGDTLILK